ncbi:hypothetical protein G7046_g9259 [Stylonectria norvegica]|nr:hypothetical protein G7046_g9259 [Stylonectria norvegica]
MPPTQSVPTGPSTTKDVFSNIFDSSDDESDYAPASAPQNIPGRGAPDPSKLTRGPHQTSLAAINDRHPYTPAKPAEAGSWKCVHYVPVWTDPEWQDKGPRRAASEYPVRDGLVDIVRPALLAKDQIRNPTEHAKRFGIFPGRSDGRSRTSPTRSSRSIFSHGETLTGNDVLKQFEHAARQQGLELDEYMIETRPDMLALNETEQRYMQAYEELLIDQYWQSVIFGNFTMDELMAENHFTMGPATNALCNYPLYPLFKREKWADVTFDGVDKADPRVLYNMDGERAEYDPKNNDKVWEAIQPGLQLATRLLEADEPFVKALQNITNRFYADYTRDQRPLAERKKAPTLKYMRHLDKSDPNWLASAARLHAYPGGYHMDPSGKFADAECATMGQTDMRAIFVPDAPIRISIAAELVWPLISKSLSDSERMVASFVFATTLVHEMMHAFEGANYKYLQNPRSFGPADDELVSQCKKLLTEMCPVEYCSEPHFEDDPVAEVGHAYEQQVLGGSVWPMSSYSKRRAVPPLLADYSGIGVRGVWPDGQLNNAPNLTHPIIPWHHHDTFLRIDQVQKIFAESFWQAEVRKYGMAALRDPLTKPAKVCFSLAGYESINEEYLGSNFGTPDDRWWITAFCTDLEVEGKKTLLSYIRCLIGEACGFDYMANRFSQDMASWENTEFQWKLVFLELFVLIFEIKGYVVQTARPEEPVAKAQANNAIYQDWDKALTTLNLISQSIPDEQSQACLGSAQTFATGVVKCSLEEYERRIVPKFMQLTSLLHNELRYEESMLCELYSLPSHFWKLYLTGVPGHRDKWQERTSKIIQALTWILDNMRLEVPTWTNEWEPRMSAICRDFTNVRNLLNMISGDDTNYKDRGWRDMLSTLPMLRKSRRKPHQRWFFLAKKEMLGLSGGQLDDLKTFRKKFQHMLSLGSYKIVVPETDVDEQGLAQRWAGLLDDVLEKEKTGADLKGIFAMRMPPVQNLVARLEKDKADAENSSFNRAAIQAQEQAAAAAKRRKNKSNDPESEASTGKGKGRMPTLQEIAAAQANQPPAIPAQLTRPTVRDSHASLSRLQLPRFGETSSISGSPSVSNNVSRENSPFTSYASSPGLFPAQSDDEPSRLTVSGTEQLAAHIHQPFGNVAAKPKGWLPHPYAIRETVTKDLLDKATVQFGTPARASQGSRKRPREDTPFRPSKVGRGPLGNLDQTWQRQGETDEIDEAQSAEQKELLQLQLLQGFNKGVFALDLSDDPAVGRGNLFFGVRSDDEDTSSSDSTSADSEASSGYETDESSEEDFEMVRQDGLKRKLMEMAQRGADRAGKRKKVWLRCDIEQLLEDGS